jgi:GDPmannose 4,6-dehydratase
MLQQETAEDFVIATGRQYSVRDFVAATATLLGMKIEWQGKGVDEIGVDAVTNKTIVRVDPRYFRPTEVESLLGDPSKAKRQLGWIAEVSFPQLVEEMVAADLDLARRDALVAKEGYKVYRHHE